MGLQINRVIDGDGIYTYLDEDVQEAVYVLGLYGFDLEEFDTFLESIKKSERLTQLLEWRSHAIHAIKTHNENAAEGWCCALNASRFEYVKSRSLLRLAQIGDKSTKDRVNGGFAKKDNDLDGKQAAKESVKVEWIKWRSARGKGRWRAGFARRMLDCFPVLESQTVVVKLFRTHQ
jgi:hypothetical protein